MCRALFSFQPPSPPSRLLAYLKDEQEYLVDAAGIDVQPWSPDDAGWLARRRRGA